MKKKSIIAIIAACAVAVGAAIAIPVSVVNCKKPDDSGNVIPEEPVKPAPDEPDPPQPDKPDPPTPPTPEKNVEFDYISKLVNLDEIDEEATAYCAATFNYNVYEGDGVYSETQTQDYYLIGAYVESAPTRFYLFDGEGKLGYITAYAQNGLQKEYFTGNKGGIATNGYCMWIACESTVYCVTYWRHTDYGSLAEKMIQTASNENGGEVAFTESFNPNCKADFVYYYSNPESNASLDKDALYVGEYHSDEDADTDHKIIYEIDGKTVVTNAYAVQYKPASPITANISARTGLDANNQTPLIKNLYTLPDNICGFAVSGNDLILTDGEKLFYYDWNKINGPANNITYKEHLGYDFEAITKTDETLTIERLSLHFFLDDFYIKTYESEIAPKSLMVLNNVFYIM